MRSLAIVGMIIGIVLAIISDPHERWDAVSIAFISLIIFILTL